MTTKKIELTNKQARNKLIYEVFKALDNLKLTEYQHFIDNGFARIDVWYDEGYKTKVYFYDKEK